MCSVVDRPLHSLTLRDVALVLAWAIDEIQRPLKYKNISKRIKRIRKGTLRYKIYYILKAHGPLKLQQIYKFLAANTPNKQAAIRCELNKAENRKGSTKRIARATYSIR